MKAKKIVKNFLDIITFFLVSLLVIFLVLYLLGYKPFIVMSGSMEPTIETGSIALVNTNVKFKEVKKNDIIAFKKGKALITHRAMVITNKGIQTKGDANEVYDLSLVTEDNFYGKTAHAIPKLGYVFAYVKSVPGIITVCIFIAVFLLLDRYAESDDKDKEIKQNKEEK